MPSEALYTMSFDEALSRDNTLLDSITLNTQEQTNTIRQMLKDKYWSYEICSEDIHEFKKFLNARYGMYREYYQELIDAYETQINMLDGDSRQVVQTGSIDRTKTGQDKNNTTFDNKSSHIDLPRSNVSEERPSDKDNSNGENHSEVIYNNTETSTYNNVTSISKGGNVIILKKQYMDMLRNVYLEFISKLEPCFIELFS